ncbi:MAG TPA: PD-(D/E)XK nuclease family protein [Longimicrobiales bacterium]|nr:PD-(D/E)XK nuclease family protein [Longimicrobiales bacterium]
MAESPAPAVLRALDSATDSYPLDRKLLVCPSMGVGRELLRALASRGRSWVGWEITTPRRLALDLAGGSLSRGAAVADEFDEEAAVDAALDDVVSGETDPSLRELAEAPGFRRAVANAIGAVRLAGIDAGRLRESRSSNTRVRDLLAAVLDGYDARLADEGLVDTAEMLTRAADAVDSSRDPLDGTRVFLVPGLTMRGAGGRLVRALLEAGAHPLAADPVAGPEPVGILWLADGSPGPMGRLLSDEPPAPSAPSPGARPDLQLFAASGPAEEVREVLRRVMEAGLRWDEVEIVATDPVVYGGALHALAERLDIPVSFAVGLPVERTRTGRATAAYFRWIQGGFPADVIRRLLEAGDLRPPRGGPPPAQLARRLRQLRIGWGRDRYLPAVARALKAAQEPPAPRRNESEEEARERVARERDQLLALDAILAPILEATPGVDPLDPAATLSPADLAAGLRSFLELVPPSDGPSATARERMLGVASRVAARLDRPTTPAAAVAVLRRHLEIRVPAPKREGSAPWTSSGGYLHLSDIDHGGLTGRRATFVVGLDAERFPGAGLQDPLLLDSQRRALDPDALPTSADRLAATRFRMAAMLARLRGEVTLSYSAWDPIEAREVAPASMLLQAFRLAQGRPTATFGDLGEYLGDAASAVPVSGVLDSADVWLRALSEGGLLLDGEEVVRSAFPALGRGFDARRALEGETATPHHGLISARQDRLDPRRNPDLVTSASGLQDLGECALRYFHKYVLGIRPPDDPEMDPDVWLNAMDRGRLLHSVYERALREAREGEIPTTDPSFRALALEALETEAALMRRDLPPPGESVWTREMVELREDVRSFVTMVADAGERWEELELRFGFDGEPPAVLELDGGTVRLRGAIDRVDREAGGLVVIDYKTGGTDRYERKHGTFHGGRRLQNVLYSAVARALLGSDVGRMEYHFPTRKGGNEIIAYSGEELRRGLGLVERLLEMAAGGQFLPTDNPDDCRFCDYAPVCRHRAEGWDRTTPRADWARERLGTLAEFAALRDVRDWENLLLAEMGAHGQDS